MGFFSNFFKGSPVTFTIHDEREAYASILLACMESDGEMSEEEKTTFYVTLKARPLFSNLDIIELISKAANNMNKLGGSAAVIDAGAAAITDKTRLALFINCVDIILSDGQVTKQEEEILDYLKSKLGVDDAFASNVVNVLLIKNKV